MARAQHRYVIGTQRRGLSEILKETGVSVEIPPEGSDSDTITLRGDPARLGEALAMVYAKATSVIIAQLACPSWLHKFIIGPKGQTLQVRGLPSYTESVYIFVFVSSCAMIARVHFSVARAE